MLEPSILGTDVWADAAAAGGGIIVLGIGWLGSALTKRWRGRRKGSTDIARDVRDMTVVIAGETPTRFNPTPPPGLRRRVTDLETVQAEHTVLLNTLVRKVTPNGGDTRETGDLLLLIAQHLGISIPEKRDHEE